MFNNILARMKEDAAAIIVVGKAGSGKSLLMQEIIQAWLENQGQVVCCGTGRSGPPLSDKVSNALLQAFPKHYHVVGKQKNVMARPSCLAVLDDVDVADHADAFEQHQAEASCQRWLVSCQSLSHDVLLQQRVKSVVADPVWLMLPGASLQEVIDCYPHHEAILLGMRPAQQCQTGKFTDLIIVERSTVKFQRLWLSEYKSLRYLAL